MAQRLQELRDSLVSGAAAYMSDRVATRIEKVLSATTNANRRLKLQFALAIQQNQAGRPDSPINTFAELERTADENRLRIDQPVRLKIRMGKAVAYMRLGEQENCLARHNSESCLFPLQPSAYHLLPRGSRGAIALFNGDGSFTQRTSEAGFVGEVGSLNIQQIDCKNDGLLGSYSGTGDPDFQTLVPNRMFRNANGQSFQEVTTATGTGHIQKGHAALSPTSMMMVPRKCLSRRGAPTQATPPEAPCF